MRRSVENDDDYDDEEESDEDDEQELILASVNNQNRVANQPVSVLNLVSDLMVRSNSNLMSAVLDLFLFMLLGRQRATINAGVTAA